MSLAELCIGFVVLGLTAYLLLGGADFGGGFWDLTAGSARRGARIRGMVQRSMSPVWEANHVWLIFILVVLWTGFPTAFASLTSTLYIPLFLAAVGIIFRGAAFALRGETATIREARTLGATFALSSFITPFFFGTVVGGIASGRVPVGNAAGDAITSWINTTSITIGCLAVATCAYLAAVYLAADAASSGFDDLVKAFRIRALLMGAVAGVFALVGLIVLRSDAKYLYEGLTSGAGVSVLTVSAVAGVGTLVLVWFRRFSLARYTSAVAVASIVVGWAVAQSPYLLPTSLTLDEAAATRPTLLALVIAICIGLVVLIPSLWFLYTLVLKGRLNQKLEPLAQQFRPITAGDENSGGND